MAKLYFMQEGWSGEDYLILFTESEAAERSKQYGITDFLPGYVIVGLRSWDDFIVKDSSGNTFTVPTIPLSAEHLSRFPIPLDSASLEQDKRFIGKMKWYQKPLVFGGDASTSDNLRWVDHEAHPPLVRYWNEVYRQLKQKSC